MTVTETLTGLRKAAVLLLQLGKEGSARVLSQLTEAEVEELSAEIARIGSVDGTTADDVLVEFRELADVRKATTQGGLDFARHVLEASLGHDRAGEIMQRLSATVGESPFGFLRRADPHQVLSFLQDEHPQTTALILAHLPAAQASQILSGLAPELRTDVAHRIAVMDRTSPEIIKEVESTLERKLSSVLQPSDLSAVGGLQPLVDIITRADRGTEKLILEGLDSRSPELAEQIRAQMFMFEDIVALEDRAVQLVLRQVESGDLATALKGVRGGVRDKILANMSERAAENLVDEVELLGTVRLRAVEEAQAKVLQVVRALEGAGEIVVRRGDDDEYVS